jgi:hypothetical protein
MKSDVFLSIRALLTHPVVRVPDVALLRDKNEIPPSGTRDVRIDADTKGIVNT